MDKKSPTSVSGESFTPQYMACILYKGGLFMYHFSKWLIYASLSTSLLGRTMIANPDNRLVWLLFTLSSSITFLITLFAFTKKLHEKMDTNWLMKWILPFSFLAVILGQVFVTMPENKLVTVLFSVSFSTTFIFSLLLRLRNSKLLK